MEAEEDVPVAFSLVQAQRADQITSNAFKELKSKGEVSSGQLRNVSDMLRISPDWTLLLLQDRVVVLIDARNRVLKAVHSAGHFGQKRITKFKTNLLLDWNGPRLANILQRLPSVQKGKAIEPGTSTSRRVSARRGRSRGPGGHGYSDSPLGG